MLFNAQRNLKLKLVKKQDTNFKSFNKNNIVEDLESEKENIFVGSPKSKKIKRNAELCIREDICGKSKENQKNSTNYLSAGKQDFVTDSNKDVDKKIKSGQIKMKIKIQDCETIVQKDDTSSSEMEMLPPDLKSLILSRSTGGHIRRPPNCFLLFSKEQRSILRKKYPEFSNRKISTILGTQWREMPKEDKMKYYRQAGALEELHSKIYPNYVYSPTVARLRKGRKLCERNTSTTPHLNSGTNVFKSRPNVGENKQATNEAAEKVGSIPINQEKFKENITKPTFKAYPVFQSSSPWLDPRIKNYSRHLLSQNNEVFATQKIQTSLCSNQTNLCKKDCPYFKPNIFQGKENVPVYSFNQGCNTNPVSLPNMHFRNMHPNVWSPWFAWPNLCSASGSSCTSRESCMQDSVCPAFIPNIMKNATPCFYQYPHQSQQESVLGASKEEYSHPGYQSKESLTLEQVDEEGRNGTTRKDLTRESDGENSLIIEDIIDVENDD